MKLTPYEKKLIEGGNTAISAYLEDKARVTAESVKLHFIDAVEPRIAVQAINATIEGGIEARSKVARAVRWYRRHGYREEAKNFLGWIAWVGWPCAR